MFKKKKKPKIPFEFVDEWQMTLFKHLGVSGETDNETLKEVCRIVLLETSRLYENICRVEDGMKPVRRG